MTKLVSVIDTMKEIECPIDQLENKIKEAYKELMKNTSEDVVIVRDSGKDTLGLKAYNVHSSNNEDLPITFLVREGEEHYVTSVEDAFVGRDQ
jgi:hypothetical protein